MLGSECVVGMAFVLVARLLLGSGRWGQVAGEASYLMLSIASGWGGRARVSVGLAVVVGVGRGGHFSGRDSA